jgi:hypothetical protein
MTDTDQSIAELATDPAFIAAVQAAMATKPRRPIVNALGQEINALAGTPLGHVTVSPGQTIASSSWGNPVWNQSIQCFASTSDRDAQWPTPTDGAMCYTVDTQSFWQYRATLGWKSPPRGLIGSATGPASTLVVTASQTVCTLTANVVAGRKYRLYCYARGVQQTAAGLVIFVATTADLANFRPLESYVAVANASVGGGSSALVSPVATGARTFTMTGTTNGGTLQVGASQCEMSLEDLGIP